MYETHIKFCGAIFIAKFNTLSDAMENYKVLRRRNVCDTILRGPGNEMICGVGEFAAIWHVPVTLGAQLAIAAN